MSYLQEHLCTLLQAHECVVVPDLGGFVTNDRSARLNRTTHRIHPPRREVSFNARLFRNDGLFAQHLLASAGVSYADALTQIRAEVAWIKRQLDSGRKVAFKEVGALQRDREGQLVFIPSDATNYLPAAFGLEPFFLVPVAQASTEHTPVVHIERASERSMWRSLAAAAVVPVLVAGSWFVQQGVSGNTFSLVPSFEKTSEYQPRFEEEGLHFARPDTSNFVRHFRALDATRDIVHYSFVNDEEDPSGVRIRLKAEAQPQPESAATSVGSQLNLYFIVGGAFKEAENAENYLQRLRSQGYDASIFDQKGDLQYVAFGSYASRKAALAELEIIRSEHPGAWLKRR